MNKTLFEKIWDAHQIPSPEGFPNLIMIDLHLVHEVTSPQAFQVLRDRKLPLFATDRTLATLDHIIPTQRDKISLNDPLARPQIEALRRNCQSFDVPLLDMESGHQGIVHVIGPELGLTHPGTTIVCGDSHTSTHGAFGALAFGIGTTEVMHVMATGCLLQKKPKAMRVRFEGIPAKCVTSKDMILALIRQIGINGGTGYVLEYTGEAIQRFSMEERMTICNMSIECGARAGLIAPDETTYQYIQNRPGAPTGEKWQQAIDYWKTLPSDADAEYNHDVTCDISNLEPMVTWGINPEHVIGICETVPSPECMPSDQASLAKKASEYVKLQPGTPIEGVPIDVVFIGSCTNGRLSDLRQAAKIMAGRKIPKDVQVYVVPGSEKVYRAAVNEGLAAIFTEAGAEFRMPGCSMCLAMNNDRVPSGKRCASTSNRNFIGRQGVGSITHLMNPMMAAAAAVTGRITDVRNLYRGD